MGGLWWRRRRKRRLVGEGGVVMVGSLEAAQVVMTSINQVVILHTHSQRRLP